MPELDNIETLPDDQSAAEFLLSIPSVRAALRGELELLDMDIENRVYADQLAASTLNEMLDRTEPLPINQEAT